MLRVTFVIGIINTIYCFTVYADGAARVENRAFERVYPLSSAAEAFAAGSVTAAGMSPSHHNVSFTAQMLLVIGTVVHCAF